MAQQGTLPGLDIARGAGDQLTGDVYWSPDSKVVVGRPEPVTPSYRTGEFYFDSASQTVRLDARGIGTTTPDMLFRSGGQTRMELQADTGRLTLTPGRSPLPGPSLFILDASGADHILAAQEVVDVEWRLNRTVSFLAASAPAAQRTVVYKPATYASLSGAQAIANAATVAIEGPPVAGANIAFTNGPYSIWVQSGLSLFENSGALGLFAGIKCKDATGSTYFGTQAPGGFSHGIVEADSTLYGIEYVVDMASAFHAWYTGGKVGTGVAATRLTRYDFEVSPRAQTGTIAVPFLFNASLANHTAVPGELQDVEWRLGRTVTFTGGGGAIPTQRAFLVGAPTYAAAAAQTITDAATVAIAGPPVAGANVTFTNGPYSLWIQSGSTLLNNVVHGSYAITSQGSLDISTTGALSALGLKGADVAFFAPALTEVGRFYGSDGRLQLQPSATVPSTALLLHIDGLTIAGTRDSHDILWRGRSYDVSPHNADWKTFADVTSNAGASTFRIQSRIDAAAFADRLAIDDGGHVYHSSGTGALPAVTFASDPDTGVWLGAVNTLSITAGAWAVADFNPWTFTLYPNAVTSGSQATIFWIVASNALHTNLTAENFDVHWNLSRTVTFVGGGGAIATQRAVLVRRPEYAAAAAQTLTESATVAIENAPAAGTNVVITNPYALWVQAGKTMLGGEVEIDGDFNHDGSNFGIFGVAPAARPAAYTITNDATDRTLDPSTDTLQAGLNVLATAIKDLTTLGILNWA